MGTSIFLARLIGPVGVIIGLGLLVNRRGVRAMAQEILRSRPLVFLFGLLDLVMGLAIVLTHNVWVASWPVIITLIGWIGIVRGTVRILAPDQVTAFGSKMIEHEGLLTGSAAVAIVLGLILSYFGYLA